MPSAYEGLPFARHALHIDLVGCSDALRYPEDMLHLVRSIAKIAGMTLMDVSLRAVQNEGDKDGWSVTAAIKESHICLHGWPACGGAMVDLVSCRRFDADAVKGELIHALTDYDHVPTVLYEQRCNP